MIDQDDEGGDLGRFYHNNPDALPPTDEDLEDLYGGRLYASWRDEFWERHLDLFVHRAELVGRVILIWLLITLVVVAVVKGDIG